MYYRLKDNFILRGYEKLPYALINLNNGYVEFFNSEAMNAIQLCDGSVDFSMPFIPKSVRELIRTLEEHTVI